MVELYKIDKLNKYLKDYNVDAKPILIYLVASLVV